MFSLNFSSCFSFTHDSFLFLSPSRAARCCPAPTVLLGGFCPAPSVPSGGFCPAPSAGSAPQSSDLGAEDQRFSSEQLHLVGELFVGVHVRDEAALHQPETFKTNFIRTRVQLRGSDRVVFCSAPRRYLSRSLSVSASPLHASARWVRASVFLMLIRPRRRPAPEPRRRPAPEPLPEGGGNESRLEKPNAAERRRSSRTCFRTGGAGRVGLAVYRRHAERLGRAVQV